MGKNQNSVVVLQIRVKFWCMIPMGVKYNHTKFEQETQRWRPGAGFASGGPQFQKMQFRAKNSHFWAKKVLWIWLKFWCMIPMDVKYNHTKFDRETRRWQPATGFAGSTPKLQNLSKMTRKCHFWVVTGAEHVLVGGNWHGNQCRC